jgi:CcmD family protein
MYEFLSTHELYIVLIIAVICWIGIYSYLVRMDRKIKKLETETKRDTR